MPESTSADRGLQPEGPFPAGSDEQLALSAAAGCAESFEQLVARFQAPLLQFLARRARSWEDAEDLVQEAFVRAYRKLDRYDPRWRFSTWLYTIAYRLNLNDLRQRRSQEEQGQLALLTCREPEPGERIDAEERHRRLWDVAAAALNEFQYNALWLFYVEELAVKEIAEVLDKSQVAIKTTLFRARKKLLPLLRSHLEREHAAAASPQTAAPEPVERTAPRSEQQVATRRLDLPLRRAVRPGRAEELVLSAPVTGLSGSGRY